MSVLGKDHGSSAARFLNEIFVASACGGAGVVAYRIPQAHFRCVYRHCNVFLALP